MIEKDRVLFKRMALVNQMMGELVVKMLPSVEGGQLNAADLRAVGNEFAVLATDMLRRADEIDRVINTIPKLEPPPGPTDLPSGR
ncbi:MAG: hypothetical protein JO287_05880 [Pseudonocardiales bacterium]|nr:hypothetical protein [Pseudonocardiales bacterium]